MLIIGVQFGFNQLLLTRFEIQLITLLFCALISYNRRNVLSSFSVIVFSCSCAHSGVDVYSFEGSFSSMIIGYHGSGNADQCIFNLCILF